MDLELATTRDIVEELRKRGTRFIFAGIAGRNCQPEELLYGCQGRSELDVLLMLHVLEDRLAQSQGLD